jgi:hypothetical protein
MRTYAKTYGAHKEIRLRNIFAVNNTTEPLPRIMEISSETTIVYLVFWDFTLKVFFKSFVGSLTIKKTNKNSTSIP